MRLRSIMFAIAIAACGGGKNAAPSNAGAQHSIKALYDRLGGMDAIDGIVKDFVEERIKKDTRISARFEKTDSAHLEQMLADQICEVTGGPCKYTGKTMREAHAGMGVNEAEFAALVDDLKASLAKFEVPQPVQDELIHRFAEMHDEIVENGIRTTPSGPVDQMTPK